MLINKWFYQHNFCLCRSIATKLTLCQGQNVFVQICSMFACLWFIYRRFSLFYVQALQMINKTSPLEHLSYDTYLHKNSKEQFRTQLLNSLWSSLPVIAVGCLFVYFLSWETQTWPTVCNDTDRINEASDKTALNLKSDFIAHPCHL